MLQTWIVLITTAVVVFLIAAAITRREWLRAQRRAGATNHAVRRTAPPSHPDRLPLMPRTEGGRRNCTVS